MAPGLITITSVIDPPETTALSLAPTPLPLTINSGADEYPLPPTNKLMSKILPLLMIGEISAPFPEDMMISGFLWKLMISVP